MAAHFSPLVSVIEIARRCHKADDEDTLFNLQNAVKNALILAHDIISALNELTQEAE